MFYTPKILIVDDDKELLETLKLDISKRFKKFDVVACASAEDAFNKIKQYDMNGDPIAFVLSDERMPGISGYEFLKVLKETHPKARKGILTAYGEKEHAIKSFQEAGIDFYLDKPSSPKLIEKNIKDSIDKYIDSLGLELRIGDIYIREVETRYELEQAFRLRYDVYVEEMGVYKLDKLTEEQRQTKQVWDEFDFRSDVIQIVAMEKGECIGRVRLIDGDCPLYRDFNLEDDVKKGNYIREASKLMIKKKYRGTQVLPAILRLVYNYSVQKGFIYLSCLPPLTRLYRKLGFEKFGEPFWHTELEKNYVAMRLDINYIVSNYKDIPHVNKHLVKMIILPISRTPLKKINEYIRSQIYKLEYLLTK